METAKKIPYISGNGNPQKLLIFWEMEPFSPSQKNFLYFRKDKLKKHFLYFLKRKLFSHFRKQKPPKNRYISENPKKLSKTKK